MFVMVDNNELCLDAKGGAFVGAGNSPFVDVKGNDTGG